MNWLVVKLSINIVDDSECTCHRLTNNIANDDNDNNVKLCVTTYYYLGGTRLGLFE